MVVAMKFYEGVLLFTKRTYEHSADADAQILLTTKKRCYHDT